MQKSAPAVPLYLRLIEVVERPGPVFNDPFPDPRLNEPSPGIPRQSLGTEQTLNNKDDQAGGMATLF